MANQACGDFNISRPGGTWRVRIVAIYTKPKRTAAEERADTIAFLRTVIGPGIADALKLLESGVHEGASKAPCMVVYSDADTDAAQLEALGNSPVVTLSP